MELVPIVEIVQVHRVFACVRIIGDAARSENIFARLVIVIIAAHRCVVPFDRLSIQRLRVLRLCELRGFLFGALK